MIEMDNPKPLRIYVAGPYSGDTKADIDWNLKVAIDAGIVLYRKGHFPLIPHLTYYVAMEAAGRHIAIKWEDYMRGDLSWIRSAEAMFFIGHSRGADIELSEATKRGLKIFYSFDEIPFIPFSERSKVIGNK